MNKKERPMTEKVECKHLWITERKIPEDIESKRECLLCKKKQTIGYLGGSMWRWEDE